MAEDVYQSALEVELKALKELCSDHEAQLFNYMRIARKRVGHLINFGKKNDLEWKRFIIDDLHVPKIGKSRIQEH